MKKTVISEEMCTELRKAGLLHTKKEIYDLLGTERAALIISYMGCFQVWRGKRVYNYYYKQPAEAIYGVEGR